MLMRTFRAAFQGVRQTLITRITWGYREFEVARNAFEFYFEAFVLYILCALSFIFASLYSTVFLLSNFFPTFLCDRWILFPMITLWISMGIYIFVHFKWVESKWRHPILITDKIYCYSLNILYDFADRFNFEAFALLLSCLRILRIFSTFIAFIVFRKYNKK